MELLWYFLSKACDELTCPPPSPFLSQQRFQDTSQYVCAELQALEQEQRQIDGRAAEVEKQLRSLMESGRTGIGEEAQLEPLWWLEEAHWRHCSSGF